MLALVLLVGACTPHAPTSDTIEIDEPQLVSRAEPTIPTQIAAETGIPACDRLWARSMACYDKLGDTGKRAKALFNEGAQAWRMLGADPVRRKQAADACKQAFDAAQSGWRAAGC